MSHEYPLDRDKAVSLAQAVATSPNAVVSQTLVKKPTGTQTIMVFDKGQGLSEHSAPFDATVLILEGKALWRIGGKEIPAEAGQMVFLPAGVPHGVQAETAFKMLLTMIRS